MPSVNMNHRKLVRSSFDLHKDLNKKVDLEATMDSVGVYGNINPITSSKISEDTNSIYMNKIKKVKSKTSLPS